MPVETAAEALLHDPTVLGHIAVGARTRVAFPDPELDVAVLRESALGLTPVPGQEGQPVLRRAKLLAVVGELPGLRPEELLAKRTLMPGLRPGNVRRPALAAVRLTGRSRLEHLLAAAASPDLVLGKTALI